MLGLPKRVFFAILFVVVAGCSGGGCSSGCSCGGMTPLPQGFEPAKRVSNAASVRLTDTGLDFLESNIGTLAGGLLGSGSEGLTFDVPKSSGDFTIIGYEICSNGPQPNGDPPECVAEIDLATADLKLDPQAPHNIRISGKLPVRLQKLPLKVSWLGGLFSSNVNVALNGDGSCPGKGKPFKPLGLDVTISVEVDQDMSHARYGYSRLRVGDVKINEDDVLDGIAYCDGGIIASIIDAVDGLLIGTLTDGLIGTLGETIESALCQPADPSVSPACPTGTVNVDGICRYGNDSSAECATTLFGLEGNVDIGSLLASVSPGAKGGFDFVFAAGGDKVRDDGSQKRYGDLNPVGNGVSLSFYGGSEPTPQSDCVKQVQVPLPTDIPVPDEMLTNTVSNWPQETAGPHFGFGLSERFTNYLLAQTYNSGALCIGVTAEALGPGVPLNTATIAVLGASSMTELGRQKVSSPVAIVLRPGAPPTMTIGQGTDATTDPLLNIKLDKLGLDFYVWSLDRYIRAMTATMDLEIPANLVVTPDGLQPVIKELITKNATVSNSSLLREDPAKIAAALEGLLGSTVGGLLGDAISPIDINGLLSDFGLTLEIPANVEGQGSAGMRKLTKGQDNFLGIFGALGVNASMAKNQLRSKSSVRLLDLQVDPAGLTLKGFTADNAPVARVQFGSDLDNGGRAMEWQYKLNTGLWRPFSSQRYVDISHDEMRIEGKHKLYVRSRIVGQPYSLDREPAVAELLIDSHAPELRIRNKTEGIEIQAEDVISGKAGTQVRVRFGHHENGKLHHGTWSEWMPADNLALLDPKDASTIEVEARDEAENIATVSQALIRGRDNAAGCECAMVGGLPAGTGGLPPAAGWLSLSLLGLGFWSRRRRSGNSGPGGKRRGISAATKRAALAATSIVLLSGLAPGCNCGGDKTQQDSASGCRARGDCETLFPGLVGAYTSGAVAPDGTMWVAGYLEANWDGDYTYGDLVVGRVVDDKVQWAVVDGVDESEEVDTETYDPKGFRGGRIDPGFDVGLWTSIAIDEQGNPGVAYYDATNKALKYAHLDGGTWTNTFVQNGDGNFGHHAKLHFVAGAPTIAYGFIEITDGNVQSGVRLALGSNASSQASWAFEDVYVNAETPCTEDLCESGQRCVASSGSCRPKASNCSADCGSGQGCVDLGNGPTCEDLRGPAGTYPESSGLYVSMAKVPAGGFGIAFYDRVKGNLVVATKAEGWQTLIVDGESNGNNTGDTGIGASLAIDGQGDFHVSYVDGLAEALKYRIVVGGTTLGKVETVDNGLDGNDGLHVVGDDSNIFITQGNEVHISYQDATSGTLKLAIGTSAGDEHKWERKTITQDGFAGFFSQQLEHQGQKKIINWLRVATPTAKGDVNILVP